MKKILFSIVLGVVLLNCKANETGNTQLYANATSDQDVLPDLATMIQLGAGDTTFDLSDYFIDGANAKIVRLPEGLQIVKNEAGVVTVKGKMNNTIDYISVEFKEKRYDIPVRNTARIPYKFTFVPDRTYNDIKVKGTFNGWDMNANPMVLKDGKYEFEVMLNPGNYQYCFVENGKEFTDPTNPEKLSNGIGGYNSTFSVGDLKAVKPFITTKGDGTKWSIMADQEVNFVVFFNNEFVSVSKGTNLVGKIPSKAANFDESYIRVYAYNKSGVANDILIPLQKGKIVLNANQLDRSDKRAMIMYSLMTDRFYDGNTTNNFKVGEPEVKPEADFQGGDFKGITKKIQEGFFKKMGTNTLWISPITENPSKGYGMLDKSYVKTKFSGYHGYWPDSFTKLDPRFGTEAEFKEMLEVAHQNNMNVLVDYVANHVFIESPTYKQHPDWFTPLILKDGTKNIGKFDEHRFTTWFDTHIPKFDYSKPEVINAVTDSAMVLYKKYDIDGFRHDAVKHIQNDFWKTLTKKLRVEAASENRSLYQIGETYGSHEMVQSYVNNGMLDGQFEFSLYHHASNALTNPKLSLEDLKIAMEESVYYYGYHNVMGNISGNHDKIRIASKADGSFAEGEDTHETAWTKKTMNKNPLGFQKTALIMAFNMTVPGVPVIYYGDEFAMPGADDPDNRRMMEFDIKNGSDTRPWVIDERVKLEATTRKMTELRKNNMALLYGDTKVLYADEQALVYMRNYMNNSVITVINSGAIAKKITVNLPFGGLQAYKAQMGNTFKINAKNPKTKPTLEISLPANSFEVLVK